MIKLDHLVLQLTDFLTGVNFYRTLFSYAQLDEIVDPGCTTSKGFRQPDGLTIWINQAEANVRPMVGSLDHFAFHCENPTEVDKAFEFCTAQGWKILSSPKAYPQYGTFYGFAFEGPDELKLEFVTR